jgi:S1/P1 Nuclease
MMLRLLFAVAGLIFLLNPDAASAWAFQGHRVTGSIADKLLADTSAEKQIKKILNEGDPDSKLDLRLAGPWPDCVKSVVRHDDGKFHYEVDPEHLEYEVPCTPFNSKKERARLEDYAKRNWTQCSYKPDGFERGCHNTYHFDDVAIQRDRFDRSFQGTNDHDLVAAIGAAIAVLSDKPIPPPFPFSIKDKKEALLLLVHLIGDLHRPLHVGSLYLDADRKLVDPDIAHKIDPDTETIGGNAIQDENVSLHHEYPDRHRGGGNQRARGERQECARKPRTAGKLAGRVGFGFPSGRARCLRRSHLRAHPAAAEGQMDSHFRQPHGLSAPDGRHQAQATRQGRRASGGNPEDHLALKTADRARRGYPSPYLRFA